MILIYYVRAEVLETFAAGKRTALIVRDIPQIASTHDDDQILLLADEDVTQYQEEAPEVTLRTVALGIRQTCRGSLPEVAEANLPGLGRTLEEYRVMWDAVNLNQPWESKPTVLGFTVERIPLEPEMCPSDVTLVELGSGRVIIRPDWVERPKWDVQVTLPAGGFVASEAGMATWEEAREDDAAEAATAASEGT